MSLPTTASEVPFVNPAGAQEASPTRLANVFYKSIAITLCFYFIPIASVALSLGPAKFLLHHLVIFWAFSSGVSSLCILAGMYSAQRDKPYVNVWRGAHFTIFPLQIMCGISLLQKLRPDAPLPSLTFVSSSIPLLMLSSTLYALDTVYINATITAAEAPSDCLCDIFVPHCISHLVASLKSYVRDLFRAGERVVSRSMGSSHGEQTSGTLMICWSHTVQTLRQLRVVGNGPDEENEDLQKLLLTGNDLT